jgi:uncharacterized protein YndB with AHSA1/START domain
MTPPRTDEVAVELTRTIDAPPEDVYRAFLDPERLRGWFAPAGFEVTHAEVEPRVGGRHRTEVVSPEYGRHAFDCRITELVPGERIALAFVFESLDSPAEREESLLTVTLREGPSGTTELTLVHSRLTEAAPGGREGVREGWGEALDRLEGLYERRTR